jgi:hypothetical protein
MEKHSFRNMIATASLVLGLSGIGPARADIFGGHLGAAAVGTMDIYIVTCPIGTASVKANVNDGTAVGNQINVQLLNPNGRGVSESAVDNGPPSPQAILAGGAGTYTVTVAKNTGVGEGYTVAMDCYDAAGAAISGTQSVLVQNQ